jgi:surface antigen
MKQFIGGLAVLLGVVCTSTSAYAINCVAYVLSVTDFHLMGDAWAWWDAAEHVYGRGYVPAEGAVMVFSRTPRMHVGHVAVVRRIVGPREIIIDQANWHHGRVDHGVSVIDTSDANDWSQVKVEWTPGFHGGPFPITGFIYPSDSPLFGADVAVDRAHADRAHNWHQPRLVEASLRTTTIHGKPQSKGKLILAGIPHAALGPGLHKGTADCAKPTSHQKHQPAESHAAAKPVAAKSAPEKPSANKAGKPKHHAA